MSTYTDISGGFPQRKVPAFRLIDNELGQVKELVDEQLRAPVLPASAARKVVSRAGVTKGPEATKPLGAIMSYLRKQVCSGKMLRPGLVLLTGRAISKITDKHIRIAAIFEIIHNATLLHDDVIDQGQKRRGLSTVNSLWGNESAVLLGDFLLSRVFKMCTELDPRFQRIIAAAVVRTCEGELRQITSSRGSQRNAQYDLTESEYIDIITEKSAALFSSCCELGGLLAKAGETQVRSLSCFGRNVGIAFQITDDLLDIIGDESKTGKTLDSDVDNNKLTLAVIHLLRVVSERERKTVKSKLNAGGESKNALVEMLRSYGSLEYAHMQAQEFVAKAIEALSRSSLKEGSAKDALIQTARFVANGATIS